mgnify:CR=1 FL=1
MAKKKKSGGGDMPMMGAISFKQPTRAQIIKSEAKYLGQRIAETDPKVKKMRDEISRAVEGAVKKALSGTAKGGSID